MRRVLFQCFGVSIYSYPTMLYIGIVLGIYASLYAATMIGLDAPRVWAAMVILIATALLGARLLHVMSHWNLYRQNARRILRCADGGASMYGGLLLAFPASFPVLAMLGLPFATFWDLTSFAMLTGMIVTRAGCFLNGCCAGRPTIHWCGMHLPNYRGVWRRRIPVQILEAIWSAAVLAGAVMLWGRLPFQGGLFLYAIGAYGLGRIVLESLRDEQDRVNGVSVHKLISLGLVTASLGFFALGGLHQQMAGTYRVADWMLALTPFLVLPIVLLFRFVGCGELLTSSSEDPKPVINYRDMIMGGPENGHALDKKVIAYWRLVDGSADPIAHDENKFRDGEYHTTPTALAQISPVGTTAGSEAAQGTFYAGRRSLIRSEATETSREFNGGFVEVPYKPNLYTDEFTIEAWVQPEWHLTTGYHHVLFSAGGHYRKSGDPSGSDSYHGFAVYADEADGWQIRLAPGFAPLGKTPLVSHGGASHIAMTLANDPAVPGHKTAKLFVDAKEVGSMPVAFYSPPDEAPLFIGVQNGEANPNKPPQPTMPILSTVQDVVLHSVALSEAELLEHVNSGRG